VSKYPRFEYSGKAVIRAGKLIAGDLLWTDQTEPQLRDAFKIANSWRNSHAYPMRSVRSQVLWHMRDRDIQGTTSARLKRMPAIRRKLRRDNISLHINQLQDLGGVRAILPSINDVRTLIETLKARSHHELREEDPYIDSPKDDGYPNYFGDVKLFRKQLLDITKGKSASEYILPPRETVPPRSSKENPDLAWIRRRRHIRWK